MRIENTMLFTWQKTGTSVCRKGFLNGSADVSANRFVKGVHAACHSFRLTETELTELMGRGISRPAEIVFKSVFFANPVYLRKQRITVFLSKHLITILQKKETFMNKWLGRQKLRVYLGLWHSRRDFTHTIF